MQMSGYQRNDDGLSDFVGSERIKLYSKATWVRLADGKMVEKWVRCLFVRQQNVISGLISTSIRLGSLEREASDPISGSDLLALCTGTATATRGRFGSGVRLMPLTACLLPA